MAMLGEAAAEKHVDDDDPGAGLHHGGDAGQPGGLDRTEALTKRDLALLTERDTGP